MESSVPQLSSSSEHVFAEEKLEIQSGINSVAQEVQFSQSEQVATQSTSNIPQVSPAQISQGNQLPRFPQNLNDPRINIHLPTPRPPSVSKDPFLLLAEENARIIIAKEAERIRLKEKAATLEPLEINTKLDYDSEEEEIDLKTPKIGEVCGKCHLYHHEDEDEREELFLAENEAAAEKEQPKLQLMSKKKSHRHKQIGYKWILCDICNTWYHFLCTGLEQFQFYLYKTFHCQNCEAVAGPSVEYPKIARHRYQWHKRAKSTKIEVGSELWIERFIKEESQLPAPNENEVEIVENGYEFHKKIQENGGTSKWNKVFLIENMDGLEMKMPEKESFDIENVVELMGDDYEVDTIDVYNQNTYSMKLKTFLALFRDPKPRKRLYNFLSLEFSENEKMRQIIKPPWFVRDNSMIDQLWPETESKDWLRLIQLEENLAEEQRPKVEEFCLSGMANSYTDFHIDFGGSSVYYHIFKGKKVFYIAPPNERNLKAFEKHETSKKTHEWFGHKIAGSVKRVVIEEGQTLLIPAGWIHAVWTPQDSLVFGGNFLHLGNAEMQMRIYQLEMAVRNIVKTEDKFYFPNFEFVHWMYVRNVILERLKESNDEGISMMDSDFCMWKAAKCFASEMRIWLAKGDPREDLEQKSKVLNSLEVQLRKQEKIQKEGKKMKREKSGGGASPEDYRPYKKRSRVEVAPVKNEIVSKINGVPVEQFLVKKEEEESTQPPPIKIKIQLESNLDQMATAKMFNNGRTSSGRKVKLNQQIVDYCGKRIEDGKSLDDETIPVLKSYAELDEDLEKCEKASSVAKPKIVKPKKEKAAKPIKEPRKSATQTTKQRLAKKLKM